MKIALVYNESEKSLKVVEEFYRAYHQGLLELDQEHPDVVVSIGGDGTLLHAMHQYQNQLHAVRFAGIHTGHLGFYTDWRDFDVLTLLKDVQADTRQKVSYPLLDVYVYFKDGTNKQYLALNEATLRKVNGTLVCDVSINGEHFEAFRGDGMCISTPTGSTGVNKSLGGAVIHPTVEVMQLTEMASINNRVYRTLSSPMIFASSDRVELIPHSKGGMVLSIDHLTFDANEIVRVECSISQKKISFVSCGHIDFWKRVENAFIGAKQEWSE